MKNLTLTLALALATLTACRDSGMAGDYGAAMGGEAPGPGQETIEPGTLTAGAWDDNLNFDFFEEYQAEIDELNLAGQPQFTEAEHTAAWERATEAPEDRNRLDIALVIDTTGSMGDELAYLQTEFDALTASIEARYPGADQRWALVVYRDQGDDYVTRSFDFTTNLDAFRRDLEAQGYGGGGDYPEAPDRGLEDAMALDWRAGNDARLVFSIADAPHQANRANRFENAIRAGIDQDVHVYPVAASGADDLTEYSMRAAAQLTGGRYLFLTDDSGVGGEHKEPDVPCYFVTRLDHAITRMVDIEMTGDYREPTADEAIRAGGDPTDGRCVLEDEREAMVF